MSTIFYLNKAKPIKISLRSSLKALNNDKWIISKQILTNISLKYFVLIYVFEVYKFIGMHSVSNFSDFLLLNMSIEY